MPQNRAHKDKSKSESKPLRPRITATIIPLPEEPPRTLRRTSDNQRLTNDNRMSPYTVMAQLGQQNRQQQEMLRAAGLESGTQAADRQTNGRDHGGPQGRSDAGRAAGQWWFMPQRGPGSCSSISEMDLNDDGTGKTSEAVAEQANGDAGEKPAAKNKAGRKKEQEKAKKKK